MNTQHQKLLALAAVVALHVGVVTLMLAQHGCKSGAQQSTAPASALPTPAPAPAPSPVVDADTGFYAPTAPAPEPMPAPLPAPMAVAQFTEPLASISSTPVPAPTPTPASAPMTVTWKVAKGDTLISIARKNGITVDQLVAANAPKVTITSPLSINQVLTVPPSAAATATTPVVAADADAHTYKVAPGDTLSKIASRNGTTVKSLKELNSLNSDNILEGQILKLPTPAASAAASLSTATATAPAPVAADASGATYKVMSGDTLGKIAARVGVKTAELMTLNGLTETTATKIKPGQILKLPATAHAPDEATSTATLSPVTPTMVTPTLVTPTAILAPSATPVTVTAFPATSAATTPPVTPINP
jgi:LysM repeat protein